MYHPNPLRTRLSTKAPKIKFVNKTKYRFLLPAAEIHERVVSATAYAAEGLRPVFVWGALRNEVELFHPKALG